MKSFNPQEWPSLVCIWGAEGFRYRSWVLAGEY